MWLCRVDRVDTSGLKFEDPSADTDDAQVLVSIIVNLSELRAADFDLREVITLQLEAVARGGRRTRGAGRSETDSGHGYQEVCTLLG